MREQERQARLRDPERYYAKIRKYQQTDKGRAAARRHKSSEKRKAWVAGYQDRARENNRRWHWKDIQRTRLLKLANQQRRRARQMQASGTATADQIYARIAFWGFKCWMCGDAWEAVDHVIPLAKGGSNWPANQRPICNPCNSSKGARRVELLS